MSIRLLSAAWDLDIGSTEKMVLMSLCDHANDDGLCWPAIATICRKTSKSERTVQGALKWLEDNGYFTRECRNGTSPKYLLNPRKICTPAETAPPQNLHETPAETAPKPSRTPKDKPKGVAHAIPDGWWPAQFGPKTKSRAIVDGWPPGELETQVEHFTAHHRARGTKFLDWQDAWSTWVLNKARFGARRNDRPASNDQAPRNPYVRAVIAGQAARAADERRQPGGWTERSEAAF